jgi:membrane protein
VPAERLLRRVRAELRFSGLAAWRGLMELLNSNDLTHAAAIAYYALLSLFPFLLLVVSLLGSVTANEQDRVTVLGFVFKYFPTQLDFVTSQLDAFRQSRLQLGVAGLLALVWGSLGVFGAVTSAVNEAWGVEKQRSFLKHRLVSFLMLTAAGGVMLLALLLVSLIQMAEASRFGTMLANFHLMTVLQTLTVRYLATVLLILGLGLVFYFVPNAKTRFRDVWVGAILTGVLWRGAFAGFYW